MLQLTSTLAKTNMLKLKLTEYVKAIHFVNFDKPHFALC